MNNNLIDKILSMFGRLAPKRRRKEVINKMFISIVIPLVAVLLLSGCAINRATATLDPTSDMNRIKSMHVIKNNSDNREIDLLIANKLKTMGYSVTTGLSTTSDVNAVVTYKDKWMWDITMYMIELTIIIRDSKTDFPLASGNSFHTSLTRKSPEEMVDEVLTNIFKQGGKL